MVAIEFTGIPGIFRNIWEQPDSCMIIVRDAEVAGSNPVASTYYSHLFEVAFLVPATGAARTSGAQNPAITITYEPNIMWFSHVFVVDMKIPEKQ